MNFVFLFYLFDLFFRKGIWIESVSFYFLDFNSNFPLLIKFTDFFQYICANLFKILSAESISFQSIRDSLKASMLLSMKISLSFFCCNFRQCTPSPTFDVLHCEGTLHELKSKFRFSLFCSKIRTYFCVLLEHFPCFQIHAYNSMCTYKFKLMYITSV
jgi:hypothetical protein